MPEAGVILRPVDVLIISFSPSWGELDVIGEAQRIKRSVLFFFMFCGDPFVACGL